MIYGFHDVSDYTKPRGELPSEALCINGIFIENIIPGYRTLYTEGRDGNSREVSQAESSDRDGARFRAVRREPREIRVAFQMESRDAREYAEKFNNLKQLVREAESKLIFNDEPDKYFSGTLTDIEVDDPGNLCVKGTLVFTCSDPYKYAVQEQTVTAEAIDGHAIIELEYHGTVDAFPLIETIARSNTETLLFTDDAGNMISVGTPDAKTSGLSRGSRIMSANPESIFNADSPGIIDRDAGDTEMMMPVREPDEARVITNIGGVEYLTIERANDVYSASMNIADSEEEETPGEIDTSSVSGITCIKAVNQTSGTNYSCSVQALFYADDFRETGYLSFGLMFDVTADQQSSLIMHEEEEAEIIIEKTGVGSPYATALLCIYGEVIKRIRIRIDADNPVTGLDGYGIGISRFGTLYTFTLGEDQYEIDASAYQSENAGNMPKYAVFSMARIKEQHQMAGMGFAAAQVIATTKTSADLLVDIMRKNDKVSINCANGDIRINGRLNPDLGAVENNWTEFSLRPGHNKIECSANTSETQNLKPESYALTYREVWE